MSLHIGLNIYSAFAALQYEGELLRQSIKLKSKTRDSYGRTIEQLDTSVVTVDRVSKVVAFSSTSSTSAQLLDVKIGAKTNSQTPETLTTSNDSDSKQDQSNALSEKAKEVLPKPEVKKESSWLSKILLRK